MKTYTFTEEDWNNALKEAKKTIKESNGHDFVKILKTRCQHCGRSPKQKGICRHWQISLINQLFYNITNK